MNSTIFGSVKNRKISYHKNVKKILVKYNQQLKFVSNTANFIKLWSKAKYAIVSLLLTHLNYKNNSPTSTGSLVIENRGVFFTMQPAKIHFGDLAVLDSNECQYQLDGQKCNFCQKLSRELAISDFEMKKN